MIEIIAEIANAHQGNPEIALKLAEAAASSGADAVKFQIYFADEFLVKKHPRYEHFKKQAFSEKTWNELLPKAKKLKVKVYADVFGEKAFSCAASCDLDGYKIHSSDLTNTPLLKRVASVPKKIFLATGGSTILEIRYALHHIALTRTAKEAVLLHGFQAYPTDVKDAVLSRIGVLQELFGDVASVGYSDHTDAQDLFAVIIPLMTVPYRITCLEKHITFDRNKKGVDYYSSFEPEEFGRFVQQVRQAEQIVGTRSLQFAESEKQYRAGVKKVWVMSKDGASEAAIEEKDLIMKRPAQYVASPFYEEIVGGRLLHPLREDEPVTNLNLTHKVLAVIVARLNSSRLPNKALLDINGKPAIEHLFNRILLAQQKGFVDTVAFCTTVNAEDEKLVEVAQRYPFKIYRGSEENVLSRMMLAIDDNNDHDLVLRITGDDLLVDPEYIHETVAYHLQMNAHYTDAKKLPSGVEVEVFDAFTLKLLAELLKDSSGSEYLTNYIRNNEDQFTTASLPVEETHSRRYRLTLDTPEDYQVIRQLLEWMKKEGKEYDYSLDDIVAFFTANPHLAQLNRAVSQRAAPPSVNTEIEWKSFTRNPLVSVYITNHNYEKYIKEAIDSVLRQKMRDFELIVIDDGSTDDSRSIIERYRHHPKVTIIYQENKGLNVSNNIALQVARGKYIMRLDADDYLDENSLLVMSNKLEFDSTLALVFPDYYLMDENGSVFAHERRHNFSEISLLDQPAHGACTMIRKDVLLELGGYSENFKCQDGYDLWIKCIQKHKVANINLPLFYYRQHGKNLTKDESRIYQTRHEIIKEQVEDKKIRQKNHLCVLPIRGGESPVPLAIRNFAGTTLLQIALDGLLKTENLKKIIVSSPDERILDYASAVYGKKIILDKRPEEISAVNKRIEATIDYLLQEYARALAVPDTITIATFEYPLRKALYVDKAINTLYLYGVDSVISIKQRNANFYKHQGAGLIPFDTNKELRLERDFIYEEIGGIHTVSIAAYKEYHQLNAGKVGHINIDEASCRKIESDLDFETLEFVYRKRIEADKKS